MRKHTLWLLLLFPLSTFAQAEFNQFYSIENLLSKELIKSVAKDKEGYLWIATDEGVLRYDGYQTNLFYRELPSPFTKGFIKRKNDQFYVVSDFGVIEIEEVSDSVHFKPLSIGGKVYNEPLNYPKSAFEDSQGNLWIGEMSSLGKYSDNGIKKFDLGEEFRSINYHRTFSFAEDAFGNLWIAPFKGPLLFYDRQKDELERINLDVAITEVCGITNVRGDYLLIGGREGLIKVKVDSDHRILSTELISNVKNISTVKCIYNRHIYVGTWTDGLYYQDYSISSSLEKISSVGFSDIVDLYFDSLTEELWVSGSENIGLFKSSIVSTIHAVGQNRIESIAFDESNGIYYSVGEQMFYLNNAQATEAHHILSSQNTYFERLLVEKNRVWVGDAFGAIFYHDIHTGKQHYLMKGTVNFSIQYLMQDRLGNKWFAGHSKGLIRVDSKDSLKIYENLAQSVLTRESKDLGLFCVSNGKKNLLSKHDPLRDEFNSVPLKFDFECAEDLVLNDFQFDNQNNIWLASDEGLLRAEFKDNEYSIVTKVSIPGLNEDEPVRAVAFVDDYLCFAISQGLVIFKDGEYILFTQDSGLPSKILQERGIMPDQQGNLFVSTAKGLAFIGKDAIKFNTTVAPHTTTLLINGQAITSAEAITVKYPYKTKVEAEFNSLSYPATNIMYQTRILGIDRNWTLPSGNRTLNVLGFSEGKYTIEMRAREDGKLWSEPRSITLEISKPWYRTWWAIGLFAVTGFATVVIATQVHNNNLIRQKKKLQKTVDERTEQIHQQNNEIIEQQKKLIQQKEELIAKNEAVYKSQQALVEADMNYLQLKEKQLQDQIEYKNKQITTHALNILQKNETLKHLKAQLEEIVKNSNKISIGEIRKTVKTIDESFKLDKDWDDFKFYFEQIHTGFYSKLNISYPDLTPLELRHCALIRLNLTLAECASILGISNDSIKVSRTRLRKKLNLNQNQSLTDFLMGI